MNGIIYCRVSSKEQTQGTSLESQESACREYARAKNITIKSVFIEQGESAKFADRTKLLELIEYSRKNKGEIHALLVWKVDRFARNVADHYSIKGTLMKYGVRIISVTEPIDANPEGRLMETILAGFAQFDNDIRAMRTVQGMRRKIHEGIFPFRPPLGYKSASDRGEKKTQPDVPDEPTFALLQRAWKALATGGYTKAELRRLMTNWGISTRFGQMSSQGLDGLFQNKYYAGLLVDPWSGDEFEGRHKPMVTREEFARVQQVIARRTRSEAHLKYHPEFFLRGLVRCAGCNAYLTGAFSRGRSRRYPYYFCHGRSCGAYKKSHAAATLHEEFAAFLTWVTPNEDLFERLGALIVRLAAGRSASFGVRKAALQTQITKLNRENQELIRMTAEGLISDEEFATERKRISELRTSLEATDQMEPLNTDRIRGQISDITQPLCRLPETWQALTQPRRRWFERIILPVGYVQGKSRTAELGHLFRLNGDPAGINPTEVDRTGFEPVASSLQTRRSTN